MPKKPVNWGRWAKMLVGGTLIVVGGPALTYYVTPTEEELFERYSPDLKKKSLERREERQQEFDYFVTKLKEYSKSDKSIWVVQAEAAEKDKELKRLQAFRAAEEERLRKEEVRREAGLPSQTSK